MAIDTATPTDAVLESHPRVETALSPPSYPARKRPPKALVEKVRSKLEALLEDSLERKPKLIKVNEAKEPVIDKANPLVTGERWCQAIVSLDEAIAWIYNGGKIAVVPCTVGIAIIDIDTDTGEAKEVELERINSIANDKGIDYRVVPSEQATRCHIYLACDVHIEHYAWGYDGVKLGDIRQHEGGYIVLHDPLKALSAILELQDKVATPKEYVHLLAPPMRRGVETAGFPHYGKPAAPLGTGNGESPNGLWREGSRNNTTNREAYVAGLKQDPELREEVRQKAKASGLPDREADYTVDRSYARGLGESDGPSLKHQTKYVEPAQKTDLPSAISLLASYTYNPANPEPDNPPLFLGAAGRGEMVMMSGMPGSGKSTFARIETVAHADKCRSIWVMGSDQNAQKGVQDVCRAMAIAEGEFPHDRIKILSVGKLLRCKKLKEANPEDKAKIYTDILLEVKTQLGGLEIIVHDHVLELLMACRGAYTMKELNLSDQQSCEDATRWLQDIAETLGVLMYNVWQGTKGSAGYQPHSPALLGMHEIGYVTMRNTHKVRKDQFDTADQKILKDLAGDDKKARIINIEKSRETTYEDLHREEGHYIWRIGERGNDVHPMEDTLKNIAPPTPEAQILDLFDKGYTCTTQQELQNELRMRRETVAEVIQKLTSNGALVKDSCCGNKEKVYHSHK